MASLGSQEENHSDVEDHVMENLVSVQPTYEVEPPVIRHDPRKPLFTHELAQQLLDKPNRRISMVQIQVYPVVRTAEPLGCTKL